MTWILQHRAMLEDITYDMVHENTLPGTAFTAHKCGYVSPSGTLLECNPYNHIDLLNRLTKFNGSFHDMFEAFQDRCDEADIELGRVVSFAESFFMVEMEYAKIAAYIRPNQGSKTMEEFEYDWKVEWIYPLTPQQTAVIYPK